MENSSQVQEFGPYSPCPIVYIDYSKEQSLIRTIFEEEKETKNTEDKMTFKKQVLYFLFIYNPPKDDKEIKESKILGRETLAERVRGFEIIKKGDEYYIRANLSQKS